MRLGVQRNLKAIIRNCLECSLLLYMIYLLFENEYTYVKQ